MFELICCGAVVLLGIGFWLWNLRRGARGEDGKPEQRNQGGERR